jgi:hypothetical protein
VTAFSLPRRDRAYAVGEHGMVFRYRVVPVETTVAHAVASPAMPGIPTALATEVTKLEAQFSALDGVVQSAPESPSSSPGDPSGRTDSAGGAALLGSADAPPSAFVAGCCGKRLSTLELLLKAVGGIVPDFLSKYKNLNLLAQGLRTASVLPETAASLKSAFRSFRSSTDRAAATTALTEVKTVLAGLKAAVDTALQKPQPQ